MFMATSKPITKPISWIIGIIIVIFVIAVAIYSLSKPSTTPSTSIAQYRNSTATIRAPQVPSQLYVSTAGSDSSNGTLSAPFKTINRAIALARPGQIIIVEPGTYNEQINITSRVIIEGEDANTTIINASSQMNGINIIGPGANGTVVSNLTVENADNHGIYAQDVSNVMITHNIVEHNGVNATVCPQPPAKPTDPCIIDDKALELVGTHNITVANNMVTHNLADGGIAVVDLGILNPGSLTSTHIIANATNNLIINNKVLYNKGGCGIIISSKNRGTKNNRVINNTVEFNPAGIIVGAGTPNSTTLNSVVINNTVYNNFLPGIIVHSVAPGATISNTIIMFNKVGENGNFIAVGALNKTGIAVSGDVMPVLNATIKNNNISNEYYGIWLRNAPGAAIQNNTFVNVTAENYTK
jgi:parallel beta-helix repeat protein